MWLLVSIGLPYRFDRPQGLRSGLGTICDWFHPVSWVRSILDLSTMEQAKQLLRRLSDDDNSVRKAAETALETAETNGHFISSVFQIVCARESAGVGDVQRMAAVIFSRIVRRHWIHANPDDPVVFSDTTKDRVRADVLRAAINAADGKLRTSLAVVVGHIAHIDWPDRWPELFPTLFRALTGDALGSGATATTRQGALSSLRCLTIISEDVSDDTLFRIMPFAMPRLLAIAQTASVGLPARKDVIRVSAAFLRGLASLVRHESARVLETLKASALPGWLSFSLRVRTYARTPSVLATKVNQSCQSVHPFDAPPCLLD